MIEAFNLDLLDDLRRRQPRVGRPVSRASRTLNLRLRAGRALIALGSRLDSGPAGATGTPGRPATDCA